MTEVVIKIRDLYKSFEGIEVLKGINLDINSGEITVIMGRSGCGKTVLVKHIVGLLKPDRGTILYKTKDVFSMNEQERKQMLKEFGFLYQSGALFDSMNVRNNVAFPLIEHTSMTEKAIDERVKEVLRSLGLSHVEDKIPAELSGGMKKRVALARAIVLNPQVIIFDEPTTGLDPVMCDIIDNLIIRTRDEFGITCIVITHDVQSTFKIADKIAMMYDGKIIEEGKVEDFKNSANPVVQQFINRKAEGPIKVID